MRGALESEPVEIASDVIGMRATALTSAALLPALLVAMAGCYSWKVEDAPLPEVLSRSEPPVAIRVTLGRDYQVELSDPQLVGDSLMGKFSPRDSLTRSVPAGRITMVESRRLDALRTAGAVLLPVMLVIGVGGYIAMSEYEDSFDD
jgi:hypothetical protein